MSLCEDCILYGRCNGACAEVDGGVNEAFEIENDYFDEVVYETYDD